MWKGQKLCLLEAKRIAVAGLIVRYGGGGGGSRMWCVGFAALRRIDDNSTKKRGTC